MAEYPVPALDYSSRDYSGLRQTMLDAIPSRIPEWTSRSPNDFGIVLIELFASMGDILSYYGDRIANECFIETATQRENILRIARMLGYRPQGITAATADLDFTFSSSEPITIPAGFQVQTASAVDEDSPPVIFTVDRAVTFTPAQLGVSGVGRAAVSATQGVVIHDEVVGVAAGIPDESFELAEIPVVESSVIVRVQVSPDIDPFPWRFIDNLLDAKPIDFVYTTAEDANGILRVVFGDGVNGRLLPRSAAVLASYRVGGGLVGNVGKNTLVEFLSPILGVTSVNNANPAVGGADPESNDSIRRTAPRSLQALRRAVTVDDYAALALQVPRVAKARAEAEVYTNVAIYIAPNGGGAPKQQLLNAVVEYMQTKKMIGVDVVAVSAAYTPIDINATITVDTSFSREQVRDAILHALQKLLAFDVVNFGEKIGQSRIYTKLANIPGVSNSVVTQLVARGKGSGVGDIRLGTNEIPVLGTVNLTLLGGIQGADPTIFGYASADGYPTAASAPDLILSRCDTSTMRLGLRWTPGQNTDYWIVQLDYLNDNGEIITTATVGTALTGDGYEFDTVKNTVAKAIQIRTQAYSASSGPAYSPYTTITNPCGSP